MEKKNFKIQRKQILLVPCCQQSRPQSRDVVGKVSDKFDDYLKRTGGRK